MSTLIKVIVINETNNDENFYFFQEPAIYQGGKKTYVNAIENKLLRPNKISGSSHEFMVNLQYYAGVQEQVEPPEVGKSCGQCGAIQKIELTPTDDSKVKNTTQVMFDGLGLSVPEYTAGVQKGAFRIHSPTFNENTDKYNAGAAIQRKNGSVVLSSFVELKPSSNLDCQPVLKFYVATGAYKAGEVMNFTSSSDSYAVCDATDGYNTFTVRRDSNGNWNVTSEKDHILALQSWNEA